MHYDHVINSMASFAQFFDPYELAEFHRFTTEFVQRALSISGEIRE